MSSLHPQGGALVLYLHNSIYTVLFYNADLLSRPWVLVTVVVDSEGAEEVIGVAEGGGDRGGRGFGGRGFGDRGRGGGTLNFCNK
ncbi:hypothetical protein DPMN_036702 [Dreissena polymorpha]|uniref:Uncharacterized protein n=1 Tax=Dreissena polymorpha TaxID=45954 RepID=A0A9D4RP30_DREPO|nr:hypothetical protein DPMN_036702 [Dreissena polymorpha]